MEPKPKTHKEMIKAQMKKTKELIIELLNMEEETYHELHYEMAFSWLKVQKYCDKVARIMVLSKTFHNWWEQQLAQREAIYVANYSDRASLEGYVGFIITMDKHPSEMLLKQIMKEANEKLKNKPGLLNLNVSD
jgi:hypothetical protein